MAKAKTNTVKIDTAKPGEPRFIKSRVLKSDKYAMFRDVFNVVLEEGKEYTEAELEKLKNDFLARPIVEEINP